MFHKKLKRLENLADEKQTSRNSKAYKMTKAALEAANDGIGVIKPVEAIGSGRWTQNSDKTKECERILENLAIDYKTVNVAPRGGASGTRIIFWYSKS